MIIKSFFEKKNITFIKKKKKRGGKKIEADGSFKKFMQNVDFMVV